MRVLLTGASGFVAQAFLARHGARHEVTILGRSLPPGTEAARLQTADLADPASTAAALAELEREPPFDAVLHLAVSRFHREFPKTALDLFHVNVHAAALLLDFAWRTGVNRVVVGSTGSVYDLPFGARAREEDVTPAKSYFAATKAAADSLVTQYRPLLPVAILRFFVPYGPGLAGRMLDGLAASIEAGRPLTIPASKPALTFSPIYSDDAADVIAEAIDKRWSETVNVATGEAIELDRAAALIAARLGRELRIERSEAAGSFYLVPDVTRLRALMPGRAFVPFEEGLRRQLETSFATRG